MRTLFTRTLYLGYYLKRLDRTRFRRFMDHVCREQGRTRASLAADILRSVYRHNVSPMDFFQFRFHEIEEEARREWAGTGFMYEYQRRMNPPGARSVLEDKVRFLRAYEPFIRRPFADLGTLERDEARARALLDNPSGRIVVKEASGQCGLEVDVLHAADLDPSTLVRHMKASGYDLAEGYVTQHPELMALSPSGLNTVRVFTELQPGGDVRLLGVRLRISVNSIVDNLAAGNLAAPVDADTGTVDGPAVYSDIARSAVEVHPVTGVPIVGFRIPYWRETLDMVVEAARMNPENRSIGWDVAVTEEGPELIEGNHNWCKLLWQLPVERGLKHMLERAE